eukprot:g8381.t1
MEASNSQGQTGRRSVQQQRRPTRIERFHSILFLRRYVPDVSELPEDAQNEPLRVMRNIFVAVLLEGLGIVVQNRNEALECLSVAVVLDGESLEVLGIRIRVIDGRGNVIYYFPLEEVATWPPRTRTLFLGNVFNQTHFAHLEHHPSDEHENLANVGHYNQEEHRQEIEQIVQLEQVEEPHRGVQFEFYPVAQEEQQEEEPHRGVQFELYPVAQEVEQQDVQPQSQVEQENDQEEEEPHQGVQLELSEVEQETDQEEEEEEEAQQNVQPLYQVEQQFVHEAPQDVQLQHEVEQVQFNNNGGFIVDIDGEVVMLDIFGNLIMLDMNGNRVLVDEDGDVVMVGVGEGVVGEGVDVQPHHVEHGYPLGQARGHIVFRGGGHQGRGRRGFTHSNGLRFESLKRPTLIAIDAKNFLKQSIKEEDRNIYFQLLLHKHLEAEGECKYQCTN